jgi:O-antigen/teichoic acid export membrane protein
MDAKAAPSPGPAPSVKRNLVYSVLYTLMNIGFPVISFAYVARILGPETLGRLNFTGAVAACFVLLASLAFPLYGARETALVRHDREKLDAIFSDLFLLNAATTLLAACLYGLCFLISARMRNDWPLFAIMGAAILFNTVAVDWFFQGLENYRFILWRNAVFKVLSLGLLLALVHRREDYLIVAGITVFANAGNSVLGFLAARKRVRIRLRPWVSLRSHFRPMGVLSASTLSANMYVYMDSVLLGHMAGNTAVGFFTSATRVTKVSISMVQSLTAVIIPRFSWYVGQGRVEEYRAMARKSLSLIWLFAFPISGLLLALAPRIIRFLSGPGYEGAVTAMRISAPLVVLMGFTNFIGLQIIFPNKGEMKLLRATLLSAGLCLVLNLLLIPGMKQNGTAIALIAAESCSAVVLAFLAGKTGLDFHFFDRLFFRYLALGAAASALAWFIAGRIAADFPAILVSGAAALAAYGSVLYLAKDPMAREIAGLAGKNISRRLRSGRG